MDKLEKSGPCLDDVPLEQIFIYSSLLSYFNTSITIIPLDRGECKEKTNLI